MKIGFIGLGKVAHVFTGAIAAADPSAEIWGFDVFYASQKERFEGLYRDIPIHFCDSAEQLARHSELVVSTVTTAVAVDAAAQIAPFMRKGQYYVDMNSTAPQRKIEIARIMEGACDFVEAAILGLVDVTGAKTKVLLCGEHADHVAGTLSRAGLNTHPFGSEIGRASMFKMIRSVFSKGVETLLIEMMVAGKKAGLYDEIWNDITDFMSQKPFRTIGEDWVATHAAASVRRQAEMEQVEETLRGLGVEPFMSAASVEVFKRSNERDISAHFSHGADRAEDVIDFIAQDTKKG